LGRELKHKVIWEPAGVTLDGTVQRACLHAIELREVGIDQNLFMAHRADQFGQLLRIGQSIWRDVFLGDRRAGFSVHAATLLWVPEMKKPQGFCTLPG
jgi:hypothetical protein